MRVLVLYPLQFYPSETNPNGGLERFLGTFLRLLHQRNVDITLVTGKDLESFDYLDKVYITDVHNKYGFKTHKRYSKTLKDSGVLDSCDYDVIFLNWYSAPREIYPVLMEAKRPALVFFHTSPIPLYAPSTCRYLQGWADSGWNIETVCSSRYQAQAFVKYGFTAIDHIIYPGIPQFMAPVFAESELNYDVCIASRLNRYKKVHIGLEAAGWSGLKTVLVGETDNPEYFVEKIAPLLDRFKNITWRHRLPFQETLEIMSHSRCNVFTSMWESCPQQPIEAMSMGTPTVCRRVGFMEEVVGDPWLMIERDKLEVEKLAVRLTEVAYDPYHSDYREVTYGRYLGNFTVERQIDEYCAALSGLANRQRQGEARKLA